MTTRRSLVSRAGGLWLAVGMALAVGATGCFKNSCESICSYTVDCEEDAINAFLDIVDVGGGFDSCDIDDPDAVEADCLDACEEAYDDLSRRDKASVDSCMMCIDAESGGACNDLHDAADDDCDDECDDEADVVDFFVDFIDEWDPDDDIECSSDDDAFGF